MNTDIKSNEIRAILFISGLIACGLIVSMSTFARVASSQTIGVAAPTSPFLGNLSDTASAPSFSWANDTNTGIFSAKADAIGFTVGGSEIARLTSTGLGINTASPFGVFDVQFNLTGVPATYGSPGHPVDATQVRLGGAGVLDIGDNGDAGIWLQSRVADDFTRNIQLYLNPNGGNVGIGISPGTDSPSLLTVGAGNKFQVDRLGNISTVGSAEVSKTLTVGRPAVPKGITLYDQDTGSPFCVTVKSAALAATPGACR